MVNPKADSPRQKEGNSDEIDSPNQIQDEEDEENKYISSNSGSDSDSVTFYDAYDHMIYDEFEKEVFEENKRRSTDFLLENTRTSLPALKPKSSINIFKILKDSIGKDLSKF